MESLHRSKIEVLRGRQEKQYSDYVATKARKIANLEAEHRGEIEQANAPAMAEEEALALAFRQKKYRLERRWRLESRIEKTKQEKITGLQFALPPDIVVGDP
jgi:hypothetical protein